MSDKPLAGKIGLVFGIANRRSIAWAIAKAWHEAGATLIFNYRRERTRENVEELAASLGVNTPVYKCDITSDPEIEDFYAKVKTQTDRVDLLLHSIAFAPKEALDGDFVSTSREAFGVALDVSAYSLIALTRAARPLMTQGGSVLTLSYYGAEKVVPHYNVMGVAKAALEASVRYLASDLGPQNIRVNAISAGPMNTLSARGISGFTGMMKHYEAKAPLRRNAEFSEVGATGVFLASAGAGAITGQTLYVDAGYCVMGM